MKKRILSLTALLLSVLLVSGCFSAAKKKPQGDQQQVSRVLIYTLAREDAIREPETADLPEPYVLPEEQLQDFLQQLSKLSYVESILYAPDDPDLVFYGHVVKIEYDNGAEEWLSGAHMSVFITPDGRRLADHYSPDIDIWEELIDAYLQESLPRIP